MEHAVLLELKKLFSFSRVLYLHTNERTNTCMYLIYRKRWHSLRTFSPQSRFYCYSWTLFLLNYATVHLSKLWVVQNLQPLWTNCAHFARAVYMWPHIISRGWNRRSMVSSLQSIALPSRFTLSQCLPCSASLKFHFNFTVSWSWHTFCWVTAESDDTILTLPYEFILIGFMRTSRWRDIYEGPQTVNSDNKATTGFRTRSRRPESVDASSIIRSTLIVLWSTTSHRTFSCRASCCGRWC